MKSLFLGFLFIISMIKIQAQIEIIGDTIKTDFETAILKINKDNPYKVDLELKTYSDSLRIACSFLSNIRKIYIKDLNELIQNNYLVMDGYYTKMKGNDTIERFYYINGNKTEAPSIDNNTIEIDLNDKEEENKDVVYTYVEKMPVFPGGLDALMLFIKTNIKYPKDAEENEISGKVYVQFIIDYNGKVISPTVVRSLHPSLDAEALRIIRMMPSWVPGQQNGKNVKVKFAIPVNFNTPPQSNQTH
jgi:TonB family protein